MPDNESDLSAAIPGFDWDLAVANWNTGRGGGRVKNSVSDGKSVRDAAAGGIRCLLSNQEQFHPRHLKELLGILIWKYTEADGKYSTGYVSERQR